ncbi:hypothetical protein TNIN_81991 [Trichonephila inaurata madagascariensis]|uniref:Uncharacterized protein n=1 Tax=Trichonephila inaurata madagascariensis TaxID=2747483 RepID=A0A8X6XH44_9ARAC|nr:hypothetical protein TNIN_396811 [Trichonephila inaurata madagascariensis]GFY51656.1 hypothetical protein TNIN_81991 [Trichonephila inaurata madagascariensis]
MRSVVQLPVPGLAISPTCFFWPIGQYTGRLLAYCYHGFWLPCRQGNFPPKVNKRQRARVIEVEAPPNRPGRVFTDSMFDIDLSLREESERISNNPSDDGTAYSNESNENLSYKSLLTLYNTDAFEDLPHTTSLCNLRQVKSLSELYIIKANQ